MASYKLATLASQRHEAWVWWDQTRRSFCGKIIDLDQPESDPIFQVGMETPILTVQALAEALSDYASIGIEQKMQLLQDKADTPLTFAESLRNRLQWIPRSASLLWRWLRP
jgi:hypothetical protein